jgi:hypothetical protein
MHKPTSRSLQLCWWLLSGTIVCVSLVPHSKFPSNPLWGYFNWYWAHFLVYVAVSILPLLAWRPRTGFLIALGGGALSAGLEIFRGLVWEGSVRFEDIAINMLGVAAGILLGLNILTLRSRTDTINGRTADGSHSSVL